MTNSVNQDFIDAMERLRNRIPNQVLKWNIGIFDGATPEKLNGKLEELGIDVRPLALNPQAYHDYLNRATYRERNPNIYKNNFTEKTFEHYIGFELLNLKMGDVFLDIAGCHSPVSEIFEALTGCLGYSHDLIYRSGLHGKRIGSDAGNIPLANSSINGALAACSIEHFEGISDILWMKETARLLRKDGKVIVAPLYLNAFTHFVTDPLSCPEDDIVFDNPDCEVYAREHYANRHGRYYSPETLYKRLIEPNSNSMDFTVYYLENTRDIDESIYCRFVLEGRKK